MFAWYIHQYWYDCLSFIRVTTSLSWPDMTFSPDSNPVGWSLNCKKFNRCTAHFNLHWKCVYVFQRWTTLVFYQVNRIIYWHLTFQPEIPLWSTPECRVISLLFWLVTRTATQWIQCMKLSSEVGLTLSLSSGEEYWQLWYSLFYHHLLGVTGWKLNCISLWMKVQL